MNAPARRASALAALLLAALTAAAGPRDELAGELREFTGHPRFRHGLWGVAVHVAATGERLWETNAARLFQPASNTKLFSGALALDLFGPEHRILTPLLAAAPPDRRGRLRGDLVIAGRGDFSWAARFSAGDSRQALTPVVEACRAAGIRRVGGDLVGDDRFLAGPRLGPGWAWDDLPHYYGAEPSALAAEENTLDLVIRPGPAEGAPCVVETVQPDGFVQLINETRTGPTNGPRRLTVERPGPRNEARVSGTLPLGGREAAAAVAVATPPEWTLFLVRGALAGAGVTVRGRDRVLRAGEAGPRDGLVEIGRITSPPMRELVARMMKPSQNLHAHTLLLLAGERRRQTDESAVAAGLRALRDLTRRAGIADAEVRLEEGAGLSRGSLLTPAAVVQLLQFMDRHAAREDFLASLPVAGVDGTLRSRLQDPAAAGNLAAKTGTLTGVHALSGFVTNAAGERLTFAILLNHHLPAAGAPTGREEVDALALLLARSRVTRGQCPDLNEEGGK